MRLLPNLPIQLTRNGTDLFVSSPCAYHKAWELAVQLFRLLSPEQIANTLQTTDFIKVIHETLDFASLFNTSTAISQAPTSGSDGISTSDSLQATASDAGRQMKRRKLNVTDGQPALRNIFSPSLLCKSIIKTVSWTKRLAQFSKDHITQERLLSKINCSPEVAAKALGCSLKIVYHNFSSFQAQFADDVTTDRLELLQPIFTLWQQSFKAADNAKQKIDDVALFQHILLPLLNLLQECRLQTNLFSSLLNTELKSYVRQYLTEPLLRALKPQSSSNIAENSSPELHSIELLTPLKEYITSSILLSGKKSHPDPELISIFLDAILETLDLNSPQDRINEGPWLRLLSAQLLRYFDQAMARDEAPPANMRQTVKCMMRSLGSYNLSFDAPTVKHVFSLYFCPELVVNGNPDWEMMRMCLEIDPKLLNSVRTTQHTNTEIPKTSSNTVLDAILASLQHLTPPMRGQAADVDHTRSSLVNFHEIIYATVIPVLEAFLTIGKLDEFFSLWEEQLRLTKDSPTLTRDPAYRTIWDNEMILTHLRPVLDTKLTAFQIAERVETLLEDIKTTPSTDHAANGGRSGWRGSLLLLQCLLSGSQQLDTLMDIYSRGIFHLCFEKLSSIIVANLATPDILRWRVWSILTMITQHLTQIPGGRDTLKLGLPFQDHCVNLAAHHDLVDLAWDPSNLYCESYHEKLEIFKYLVKWTKTAASTQQAFFSWDNPPPFLKRLSDSLLRLERLFVDLYGLYGELERQHDLLSRQSLTEVNDATLTLDCAEWFILDDLAMKYMVSCNLDEGTN